MNSNFGGMTPEEKLAEAVQKIVGFCPTPVVTGEQLKKAFTPSTILRLWAMALWCEKETSIKAQKAYNLIIRLRNSAPERAARKGRVFIVRLPAGGWPTLARLDFGK